MDERGVRVSSVTNQLRALAKQRPRRRQQPLLQPIPATPSRKSSSEHVTSVQKQIQGPLTLQWLVDDFVDAAARGDEAKVERLLRGGIPIDMKHSVLHCTALQASTALGANAIAKLLIQGGADVNSTTKGLLDSPLHLAARFGTMQVADELLRNQADLTALNANGQTPLQIAIDEQSQELTKMLEPPPEPPTNVHAGQVSSTTLTMEWTSRQPASSPYQFTVEWRMVESTCRFSEVCSKTTLRIVNLTPATAYEVCVKAGNHLVGWNASDAVTISTDRDVPSAMIAPSIIEVSDQSVLLHLCVPACNGAAITRLAIETQCTGALAAISARSFRQILQPDDSKTAWDAVLCELADMRSCDGEQWLGYKQHSLTGLLPGRVYYFRAKAWNALGWSSDGEMSDGICTNDSPKVVQLLARSVTLIWTKPYSTQRIDQYEVQVRAGYSTVWDVAATGIVGQRAEVSNLLPATAYCFRVVPHFEGCGWGDPSKCTCTSLHSTHPDAPEPPTDVRIVDRTSTSLRVTWGIPRCNGHAVKEYVLEFQQREGANRAPPSWQRLQTAIPIDFKIFALEQLTPGCAYQVRVAAVNAVGTGAFSAASAIAWTHRFAPPSRPECVAKTNFSLTITWQHSLAADFHGDATAIEYEVQLAQVDSRARTEDSATASADAAAAASYTWQTARTGVTSCHAEIAGLAPLGCYCFRVRVRACNGEHRDTADPIWRMQDRRLSRSSTDRDADNEGTSVFSPISAIFQTMRRM